MKEVDCKIQHGHRGNIIIIEYHLSGTSIRHREDGPATITYYPNGLVKDKTWYNDGKHCRSDGPAYLRFDSFGTIVTATWVGPKGYIHREDGPAQYDYNKWYWFIYGIECDPYWHRKMFGLAKSIRGSRDMAIMNCKHKSEYIRDVCEEVLNANNN
jgi:hypothetical protein